MKNKKQIILMLIFLIINLGLINYANDIDMNKKLSNINDLIREGNYDKAMSSLDNIIIYYKKNSRFNIYVSKAYYLKAKIYYIADEIAESNYYLEKAIKTNPGITFYDEENKAFQIKAEKQKKELNIPVLQNKLDKPRYKKKVKRKKKENNFIYKNNQISKNRSFFIDTMLLGGLTSFINIESDISYTDEYFGGYFAGLGFQLRGKGGLAIELNALYSYSLKDLNYSLSWSILKFPVMLKYFILQHPKGLRRLYISGGVYYAVLSNITEDLYYSTNDLSDFKNPSYYGYVLGLGFESKKYKIGFRFDIPSASIFDSQKIDLREYNFKYSSVEIILGFIF